MKHLLVFLLLTTCGPLLAQPLRVSYFSANQIAVSENDGSLSQVLSTAQVAITYSGSFVSVSYATRIRTLALSEFLDATGTAWSAVSTSAAVAAFQASAPTSSGATTFATFGTTPPSLTDYTGSSGTISTTNVIRMYLENVGSASGTMSYGGSSFTLAAGDQREFIAFTDATSGKLTPFLTLSVNGTGTTLRLTKYFKQ